MSRINPVVRIKHFVQATLTMGKKECCLKKFNFHFTLPNIIEITCIRTRENLIGTFYYTNN